MHVYGAHVTSRKHGGSSHTVTSPLDKRRSLPLVAMERVLRMVEDTLATYPDALADCESEEIIGKLHSFGCTTPDREKSCYVFWRLRF